MKKNKPFFILALFLNFSIGYPDFLAAKPDWRRDFDRICAHTAEAGKLNVMELSVLIQESDKLLRTIRASDDPEKKVYLIRLKKCRKFLDFMRTVSENPERY